MRLKPSLCPALTVFLLAMAQAGCGGVVVERESAAEVMLVDGESKESQSAAVGIEAIANNVRTFGLMGIIVPFIPVWHSADDKNGFTIYITFTPGPRDDLWFDPKLFVLMPEHGEPAHIRKFEGPFNADPHDFTKPQSKEGEFPIHKKVSVHVVFPINNLPPDESFTVVLKGLYRSGEPIEAPKLKFKKQTSLSIRYIAGFFCVHCGPFIDSKWVISR